MAKKNVIVDHRNVTEEILESIMHTYPYGYDDSDLIKYVNAKGETVAALEVDTGDVRYLIKIGVEMDKKIIAFSSDSEDKEDKIEENMDIDVPDDGDLD
jgi:hypothetical protein